MTLALRQIPSPNFGGTRGQILWIIVHTAEGALTVDSLGRFFANPASQVSSHVGIDDHEIVQYVPYTGQAWTARSANPYADQAELCAFAAWTRATWLQHPAMLENTARWIADRCQARGIPAVKIGPADVAARKPGVIGHVDITNGLHDGTHTDPGGAFPWDVVMARVDGIMHPAPAPPANVGYPSVLRWNLPAGHYYGNIAGPANCHGGATAVEKAFVRNIQQWLIRHGMAFSHYSWTWATSGWADGIWGPETDTAMAAWHSHFYPGQPKAAQCWSDDYARLAHA